MFKKIIKLNQWILTIGVMVGIVFASPLSASLVGDSFTYDVTGAIDIPIIGGTSTVTTEGILSPTATVEYVGTSTIWIPTVPPLPPGSIQTIHTIEASIEASKVEFIINRGVPPATLGGPVGYPPGATIDVGFTAPNQIHFKFDNLDYLPGLYYLQSVTPDMGFYVGPGASPNYPNAQALTLGVGFGQGITDPFGGGFDAEIYPTNILNNTVEFDLISNSGFMYDGEWRAVFDLNFAQIPEPSTYLLLGSSLLLVAVARKRKMVKA